MSFLGMWKFHSLFIQIILHDFGFYACIHVLAFDICVIHPHGTRVAYPQLPSLAQGALNSTNACYEACGEVELLATIANRAHEILKVGGTPDCVNIASMAAAGQIANYSHVLAKFVQSHAGGPPFSCIDYLTSFVHQDKSVALGKEFMQSVVETDFSNTSMFPLAGWASWHVASHAQGPKSRMASADCLSGQTL